MHQQSCACYCIVCILITPLPVITEFIIIKHQWIRLCMSQVSNIYLLTVGVHWQRRLQSTSLLSDIPVWQNDEDNHDIIPAEAASRIMTYSCSLHKVLAAMDTFLTESFSKPIPNTTRRHWQMNFRMPVLACTKCLKLEYPLCSDYEGGKGRLQEFTSSLCQTVLLGMVGPLASMMELHHAGTFTADTATEAASQALKFLGNASSHVSAEWRKAHLSKDLHLIVEEPEGFTLAALYLFGKEIEKEAREHIDALSQSFGPPWPCCSRGWHLHERQYVKENRCPRWHNQQDCQQVYTPQIQPTEFSMGVKDLAVDIASRPHPLSGLGVTFPAQLASKHYRRVCIPAEFLLKLTNRGNPFS